MDQKLVLTDSSRMTTGHGRVGQNQLLNGVEPHTTGCVRFDPVFSTLRISMNRLWFRFEPKREKNRTEPDFQTLIDWPISMTREKVKSFLGFGNIDKGFIQDNRTLTEPLKEPLKTDGTFLVK